MEGLPKKEEEKEGIIEKPTVEDPKQIAFLKKQWKKYENLTAKDIGDNLWIIGLKFLLKGVMVFILILLSPFILMILIFTLLVAA